MVDGPGSQARQKELILPTSQAASVAPGNPTKGLPTYEASNTDQDIFARTRLHTIFVSNGSASTFVPILSAANIFCRSRILLIEATLGRHMDTSRCHRPTPLTSKSTRTISLSRSGTSDNISTRQTRSTH